MPSPAHANPRRDSCGLEWAHAGSSGLARAGPDQIPVQAQSNPAGCPDWARTGQAGLARSNPTRAPAGLAIWDLALIPYGPQAGFVWAHDFEASPRRLDSVSRHCPDWARTGQTGLARSNLARAPAGLAIWDPG